MEQVAAEKLLGMLPPELRPRLRGRAAPGRSGGGGAGQGGGQAVRATSSASRKLKAGNNEFRQAAAQTAAAMDAMRLPELDYFREHFLPSYSLTLDELE